MSANKKTTVLMFGTFDVLHKGHLNLFQQAKALAENVYLIVSIARDKNITKIKGQAPHYNEIERLSHVANLDIVDNVILGSLDDYISHIVSIAPDIIALGYDQTSYTEGLEAKLKERGLDTKIIRLEPFEPDKYKSSILKRELGLTKE